MGEWKDPYNVLGFVGGVVLAAALLPQIYLAHKRESTADISYMWQVSGTALQQYQLLLCEQQHVHKALDYRSSVSSNTYVTLDYNCNR